MEQAFKFTSKKQRKIKFVGTPLIASLFFLFAQNSIAADQTKVLQDSWYTILINKKVKYGYYHEKLVEKKGLYYYESDVWKDEEGYINQEHLESVSRANSELVPESFSFTSTYRNSKTVISGVFEEKNGTRFLRVKIEAPNKKPEEERHAIPKGTILSSFFSLWAANQLDGLKPNKGVRFKSILEDDSRNHFAIESGEIQIKAPDEFAKKSNSRLVEVSYRYSKSRWWLNSKGIPTKIEIPTNHIENFLVTEATAKSYLKK